MTVNLWGSDEPVEATKGGTGQSTYTAGDIIYASAANTWSKLAIGSNNEVLTLASGVPSWAAESGGGGGWQALASSTASASSSINFDSTYITSTYDLYLCLIFDWDPSADSDCLMQFSPDNGTTIRTTGYESSVGEGDTNNWSNITNGIEINRGTQGSGQDGLFGWVYIANPSQSGVKTAGFGGSGHFTSGGSNDAGWGYGKYDTAETHNYIRFTAESGNITHGDFYLYGLEKP